MATLLWLDLLDDVLFETAYLDKPPHRIKVGYIEGVKYGKTQILQISNDKWPINSNPDYF